MNNPKNMLLGKEFRPEIDALIAEYLHKPVKGLSFFGEVEDDVLLGFGGLKCYCGSWYLRAAVVKPEFRGRGLQRQIIRERIEYLQQEKPLVDCVRATIYSDNHISINNVLSEGFVFEKNKRMDDGVVANVYKKMLKKS